MISPFWSLAISLRYENAPNLVRKNLNWNMMMAYFFGRVTSKTFVITFTLVTLLCVMDLAVIRLGAAYLMYTPIGDDVSYGTIASLYFLCVIEALGMSVFARAVSQVWKGCKTSLRIS